MNLPTTPILQKRVFDEMLDRHSASVRVGDIPMADDIRRQKSDSELDLRRYCRAKPEGDYLQLACSAFQ